MTQKDKVAEAIQKMASKVGPQGAFDMLRDAKAKAIEKILIAKGIATQAEINSAMDESLAESVEMIQKMPPLPNLAPTKNRA